MSEKFQKEPPIDTAWRKRGSKDKPYRARRVSHDAETSIEYGEKTWTTAQTVRDLMQNHLDAETERYYQQIAEIVFDEDGLERYFDSNENEVERKRAEDLLYATFLYAKHAKDMTSEARLQSEAYLQELAQGLSVDNAVRYGGTFYPPLFLEAAKSVEEERPLVSYEVRDTENNTSIGWMAYETLRDEALYQLEGGDGFRYEITGMKIVDRGFGFDSQLSALYVSSKTDKQHLRGKFGEGAKMSELHLLRNGASMTMRSRYTTESGETHGKSRVWQARPMVKGSRLVSRGVEVEQESEEGTGSMVSISLQGAKEAFRKEFIKNIDPRLKGLEDNVADFGAHGFSYPMPVMENPLTGVDTSGSGNVQYVQGLRVELAKKSFGYNEPWFSYNFLDSSVIAGRDRSELSGEIIIKIREFWEHVDSPELLEELVHIAVQDTSKKSGPVGPLRPAELNALSSILTRGTSSESWPSVRIQEIVDRALLQELELEEGVHTLVVSRANASNLKYKDAMRYAREKWYVIKLTASAIEHHAIKRFAERLPDSYKVVDINDIHFKMLRESEVDVAEVVEVKDSEREKAISEVFNAAVASLNKLVRAAGYTPKSFKLKFDRPNMVNVGFWVGKYKDNNYDEFDHGNVRPTSDSSPIFFDYDQGGDVVVFLNPDRVLDPRHVDPLVLQRQIEIHLLSSFGLNEDGGRDEVDMLKGSQNVLNRMIANLIPKDAPILDVIPEHFDYAEDSAVLSRLTEALLGDERQEGEEKKFAYAMYLKALNPRLTLDEAQKMHKEASDSFDAQCIIESRVFLRDETFHYYDSEKQSWEEQQKDEPITVWQELPVYSLGDGRYFVQAPMEKGAVLAKGEGKKREYIFSEDDDYLHIGLHGVEFCAYGSVEGIDPNPDGIIVTPDKGIGSYEINLSNKNRDIQEKHINRRLEGYVYYPAGAVEREKRIDAGLSSTAIPIEYGQDEWDNPVRIFQDVIQNHIDASHDGEKVRLIYEVDRAEGRVSVSEEDLTSSDRITGLSMEDSGLGYYPSEIAVLGASSKKSPLFAGKYGEGQKMIAAATLRNNLELVYGSTVSTSSGLQSWSARAVKDPRLIVIDRKEVEKNLVAFDVASVAPKADAGSVTMLRLPEQATEEQQEQWAEWVSIVDPRQKDASGHGGLARYVRQLREEGSERTHTVGSVSVLLDEAGAVYENGLRINSEAEAGRSLSFGYDVPEVVTTRERNSYNSARLGHYMRHAISNITDQLVVKEILRKYIDSDPTLDLNIGRIMSSRSTNAAPIWAEVAQKIWPGWFVYSSERINAEIDGEFGFAHAADEWRES